MSEEKKKVDNVEEFTSERIAKERAASEEHILRAQKVKKEEGGR